MASLQVVNGTAQYPDGTPVANGTVTITLAVASAFIGSTQELARQPKTVSTNSSGVWTVSLYSNDDITPAGTTYQVIESDATGAVNRFNIQVPNAGGPFRASSLVVAVPIPPNAAVNLSQLTPTPTVGEVIGYDGGEWAPVPGTTFGATGNVTNSAPGDARSAGATGLTADAGHRHGREGQGLLADIQPVAVTAAVGSTGRVPDAGHVHPPASAVVSVPSDWGRWWRAKRDAAGSSPAVIAVVGDSISRGFWSSSLTNKGWVGLVRASLQASYGDGGCGFRSVGLNAVANPSASGYSGDPEWAALANAANWAAQIGIGLAPGNVDIYTTTVGETVTFTHVRGATIDVFTLRDKATNPQAQWSYSIDGGAFLTVTPPAADTHYHVDQTSISVGAGDHTVALKYVGATGTFFSLGVRGRNATGVRLDNYALSGSTTGTWTDNATDGATIGALRWSGGQFNACDLLIYSLGINDAGSGTITAATFESTVATHLDEMLQRTSGRTTDVLIVVNHIGKAADALAMYPVAAARLRGLALSYNAALVDVWSLYGHNYPAAAAVNFWSDGTASGIAGTDVVHPGDIGHQLIANQVLPILTA